MKPLIWKELREMALWAGLIILGLILAEAYTLNTSIGLLHPSDPNYPGPGANVDSAYASFKLWMQLGAPIAAFVLGLLQIVPEQRRDQWAFLTHRPVMLRTIFLAKTVAGIGLYLVATAIPLALYTMWLGLPRHYPGPFPAILALPDVAAILAGIPFYFAAMMLALRPARWWGSKVLPVVFAITAIILVEAGVSFASSAAMAALYIVVSLVGAWGCFVASGEYQVMHRVHRIALNTVLLVGATTVVVCVIGFVAGVLGSGNNAVYRSTQYMMTRSGRLVQTESGRYSGITHVYAADATPLPGASLNDKDYISGSWTSLGAQSPYASGYSAYENYFTPISANNGQYAKYDIYDRRARLIDVFSSDDRGFVGYLGARGVISPTVALAVPFAMSQLSGNGGYFGQDSALISFPDAIYRLDISTQRLTLLAVPPANQRFVSVSSMWETKTSGEELANFCIVAALPKAIEAFDQNGAALVYAPIPDPTTKFYAATVWYWRHPARFNALFMAQPTGSAQPDYVHHPYRFITVNAAGVVTSEIATHPVEFNVGKQPSIASAMAMLVIVPIGAIVGATVIGVYAAMGQPHALADAYHYIIHFQYLDLAVIWTLVGAVIFALVMLAFGRVYAWNRRDTIKWMIGGALLSWPGILMLLAVVPFPLRIACSSCGRKRLASRMTCEHCGAAAMQPARDGTEIFAGAAKELAIAE